jgi:hypothetical protein
MMRAVCISLIAAVTMNPYAVGQDPREKAESGLLAKALYWGWNKVAQPAIQGAASELSQEAIRRASQRFLPRDPDGTVYTGELRRLLDALATVEAKHASEIRELRSAVRERMTREEVRDLLLKSLTVQRGFFDGR